MLLLADTPPALVSPAPMALTAAAFQSDFDAAATPAVRDWVDSETTTLLGHRPLDLRRLSVDAAARSSAADDPATAALILRYAVELRLQAYLDRHRPAPSDPNDTPAMSGPSGGTGMGHEAGTGSSSGNIGSSASGSQGSLMQATPGMQETQMSFNMQYLQLKNVLQNDNRQFTMVSNILQTKSATVKNTISNIR